MTEIDTDSGLQLKDDLEQSRALLAEYKQLADAQRKVAERFTNQARQAFAYVSGFFTIAQAAAVASIGQKGLGVGDKHAILIVALVGSGGLVLTAICAFASEYVREYPAVGTKYLLKVPNEAAKQEVSVEFQLAKGFKQEVGEGDKVLRKKLFWLRCAQACSAITVGLVAGELVTALAARL